MRKHIGPEVRAAVIRLYVEERVSSVVIGRAFNMGASTVHSLLRDAGIRTRTCSEAAVMRFALVPRKRSRNQWPTYHSWTAMRQRCSDQKHPSYPNYGGRGITVCDRWRESFESFLADLGERPDGTTLDRIDVNGNYAPSNCRWATYKEQRANSRGRT